MTIDERIEQLKEKTNKLEQLLNDPHPGTSTWMKFVADALDDIAEYAPSFSRTKK